MNCAWLFLFYLGAIEYREASGFGFDDLDFARSAIEDVAKSITSKPAMKVKLPSKPAMKVKLPSKPAMKVKVPYIVPGKVTPHSGRAKVTAFSVPDEVTTYSISVPDKGTTYSHGILVDKVKPVPYSHGSKPQAFVDRSAFKIRKIKVPSSKPRNLNKFNEAMDQVERAMAQAELSRKTAKLAELKNEITEAVKRGNIR